MAQRWTMTTMMKYGRLILCGRGCTLPPVTWQLLERYFQAVFDKHWRLPTRSDDDGIADDGVAILHELLSTERLVPSMSTTLSSSGGGGLIRILSAPCVPEADQRRLPALPAPRPPQVLQTYRRHLVEAPHQDPRRWACRMMRSR
jgi:hypothetical protein